MAVGKKKEKTVVFTYVVCFWVFIDIIIDIIIK